MCMAYQKTVMEEAIHVDSIVTVHYFEYNKNFMFSGESHDFWEFVYVDKGEITAITEKGETKLRHGEIIFHRPNEWHNIKANGVHAANVVIMSFTMRGKYEDFFSDAVLKVGNFQKILLSKIINESIAAFSTPLDDFFTEKLAKRSGSECSQQLVQLYLTEFLIGFFHHQPFGAQPSVRYAGDNSTFAAAIDFMEAHLSEKLYISDVADSVNISVASLKKLFRKNAGCGVIEYFNRLKIEKAKEYLRENNYNITGISELLGYSTVFYFSGSFKKHTGMSPAEYARSVKALVHFEGAEV